MLVVYGKVKMVNGVNKKYQVLGLKWRGEEEEV